MEIINKLIEIIFPKRPDAALLETVSTHDFIRHFTLQVANTHQAALPFREPVVRAAIHELKFYESHHAQTLLLPCLQKFLAQQKSSVVIPIPLSRERLRSRGYNQVALLTKPACRVTGHQHCPELLKRALHTESQTKLSRTERLTNLKGAFVVPELLVNYVAGQHLIVVDDVTTTGATLEAAKVALEKHHPASVTCFALAH